MSEHPNIVIVVFDTARRDRFGCYGYGRPTTPTVDSLARSGLVLETMISNAPWTLPAHGSLFTGLYPTEHGAQWQTGPALRDAVTTTMAESLKELGYDTVCVTNNGLVSNKTRLARGFDTHVTRLDLEKGLPRVARRVPKALFGGDSGGRIVNRWMASHLPKARKPTFLFVNYMECHWAYAPPPKFARRVGGPRHRGLAGLRYRTSDAVKRGPWEAIARADTAELERLSALYDGELANVDHHLAQLLEILEASGHLKQPTVVMVASDHGEHIGEHGLADHHASLDDLLTRVPFVAWGPGIVEAGRSADTFEFVDVLPSVLSLLDRPVTAPLESRRRGALTGKGDGRAESFAEWRGWPEGERERLARRNPSFDFTGLGRDLIAVRDARWKLVRGSDGVRQLFDLETDPQETTDRSADHPADLDRLGKLLDGAVAKWSAWDGTRTEVSAEEQAEIEARLEELGYI